MKLIKILTKFLSTVALFSCVIFFTLLAMHDNIIPLTPFFAVNGALSILFSVVCLGLVIVSGITIEYVWSRTGEPYRIFLRRGLDAMGAA